MTHHEPQSLPAAVKAVVHPLLCDLCRNQSLQNGHEGDSESCADEVKDLTLCQRGQGLRGDVYDLRSQGTSSAETLLRLSSSLSRGAILVLQRRQYDASQLPLIRQVAQQDGAHRDEDRPRNRPSFYLGQILHQGQQPRNSFQQLSLSLNILVSLQNGHEEKEDSWRQAITMQRLQRPEQIPWSTQCRAHYVGLKIVRWKIAAEAKGSSTFIDST